jgi:hypothetical protein
MGKNLGRFSIMDGRATRIAADEARKTKIATFPGEHYSSELENGQLHVYSHTDEHGNPAKKFGEPEGTSGIRSSAGGGLDAWCVGPVKSISELNALHSKHHEGVGRIRPRA